MSNKTIRISDKLARWEAENNPLAPLSSTQINAYMSLSEKLGNTDFIVCVFIITRFFFVLLCVIVNFSFSLLTVKLIVKKNLMKSINHKF